MLNIALEGHLRMYSKCTSSRVDGSTSLSNCSSESKWDMATVKLFVARMIVLHELPLAFVEYVGFYDLLKLLQPSIETISRNPIKAKILRLYDVEKKKTMGILEACESRITITTDMWTASNQKKDTWLLRHITLIAHKCCEVVL